MQIVKTANMKALFMSCINNQLLQTAFSTSVILKRRCCILYLFHSSSVAFNSSGFLKEEPAGTGFNGSEFVSRAV